MMTRGVAAHLKRRRFDVTDVRRMAEAGVFGEDERFELIDGELIEMAPPPGPLHSGQVNLVAQLLFRRCGDRFLVQVQNPLQLDPGNLVLPDVAVLRHDPDGYRTRYPGPGDVLLVIEVADTSLARDRRIKLPRYASHGVPEVWILDLRRRCVHAFAEPEQGRYRRHRRLRGPDRLALPDREVTVDELLA